ncbi:MAG TPA: helix-turn-helix domain-containing protein [Pyrinomonadaceae bacterium]|jgi:tetratricopeptide (TPR) repeat protein
MRLTAELRRRLEDPALGPDDRALRRVELSKKCEEAGDFEAAREALGDLWQGVGVRPRVEDLREESAVGEVLLRVGALTGWIASSQQIRRGQEQAKDLLSESASIFERLGDSGRAAEAHTELAYCYWREGAFDEALVILGEVLRRLSENESERRALVILRLAIVEASATRYNDALRILTEAAPLFETTATHAVKGKFHNELANVLNQLSVAERRRDYADRALVEYAAAGFHFEAAKHTRNQAAVENNLGYLFSSLREFEEAHAHLDRARRLFVRLKDSVHSAQVDETRARAFLAQGRYAEAEKLARLATGVLSKGGELALLSEALTTHGVTLARLGRHVPARAAFVRSREVAELAGDLEGAGLALLALIEELGGELTFAEIRRTYERADHFLSESQDAEVLTRLRRAAAKVFAASDRKDQESDTSRSLAGSGASSSAGHSDENTKHSWQNFSLKEEVRQIEERYIRLALEDSEGRVSHAAKLLGFEDHGSLNSLLKNKYPHLRAARLPPTPRKRSIIRG